MAGMLKAIGLMSGTSLDGIDVALLRTDGEAAVERGPSMGRSYDAAFRRRLQGALETAKAIGERGERPGDLAEIERELTLRHAETVRAFLAENNLKSADIDIVGFHGQTVLHRPNLGLTVQLGDGDLLARETGIDVVYDMRANDMAHGGQGAPLIPAYHAALATGLSRASGKAVVFVNIGGISNITFVGSGSEIVAYDSGPGNTLIDQWVEAHAGIPYDQGGMIASEGRVDEQPLKASIAAASPNQAQRRKQDRKKGMNYQLVTKQTNWYSATTSAVAAKARRERLPWATRKLCP